MRACVDSYRHSWCSKYKLTPAEIKEVERVNTLCPLDEEVESVIAAGIEIINQKNDGKDSSTVQLDESIPSTSKDNTPNAVPVNVPVSASPPPIGPALEEGWIDAGIIGFPLPQDYVAGPAEGIIAEDIKEYPLIRSSPEEAFVPQVGEDINGDILDALDIINEVILNDVALNGGERSPQNANADPNAAEMIDEIQRNLMEGVPNYLQPINQDFYRLDIDDGVHHPIFNWDHPGFNFPSPDYD